jgi:hypothetical protein
VGVCFISLLATVLFFLSVGGCRSYPQGTAH